MVGFNLRRTLSCGCCIGALVSVPAFAQPAGDAGNSGGEIVVTAQRRSENVQDVPMTVNAFSADQIASRGIANINDIAGQTPGLRFNEFANAGNISLRGIGTAFVSGNGESSVALYIDGVFIPQAKALGLAQFDLGGIEVLRGPQGTLYGRNSTGGVINMTSNAPTREFSAGLTAGIGNFNQRKASAYVSGPLGERVAARLYVEGEDRDGYIKNVNTGQDLSNLKALGGRLGIDAQPVDGWDMKARVTGRVERSDGPAFDSFDPNFAILSAFGLPAVVTNSNYDPYKINTPTTYYGKREIYIGSLKNTFSISDGVNLNLTTGYTNARFNNTYDTLGSALPYPITALAKSHSFSQEINLSGESAKLDWLVGAYYFNQRYTLDSLSTPPAGLGPVSRNDQTAKQQSYSAFGDATIHVGSSTHIFGGARVSRETVDQQLKIFDITGAGEVLRCPVVASDLNQHLADTHVTGRLGARQDLGDDANVYFQASHGYKAPSFSQSNCQNPFKPETVNALEAGVKTRLLDRRATFNVSVFYSQVKNLQLEIVSPLGVAVNNVPRAEIYGAEFALHFEPVPALRLDANLSLLHARYTRSYLGDGLLSPTLTPQDIKGHRLNNAPDVSGYFGAEYELGLGSAGSLTARGEMNFTSEYNLREVNFPWTIQEGNVTGNAYLTYRTADERYSVRGWVKNIGNKAILGGVLGFGGVIGSYQPPRTYGVEVGAKF